MIIAPQISSLASECLAAVKICMSDLCKREQAFYDGICEGKKTNKHISIILLILPRVETSKYYVKRLHFLRKVSK